MDIVYQKIYNRYIEHKQNNCFQCCLSGFTSESLKHHTCTVYPNYKAENLYKLAAYELLVQEIITFEEYSQWHKQWLLWNSIE